MHQAGDSHHHGVGLGEAATGILAASIVATLLLVVVEFAAGYTGKSIALVSDAIHNLTDAPTLVISWLAIRWALRPATPEKTYGYHRAGILAAFVNAIVLTLAALVLIGESVIRLRHPVQVQTGWMMWVSIFALAINGGITLAVSRGRGDLNVRTVWIHNLGDALSNVAILVGALIIRYGRHGGNGGFQWLDPLIGMGIGVMVLLSGAGILRESGHILLEGLPRNINLQEVARAMLAIDGVEEVHDIHIWTLGPGLNALSCHVRIPDMHLEHCERLLGKVRAVLAEDFNITHTTIQFERAGLPASGLFMPEPVRHAAK
jgi:cobalt-zinc-cadmium efflux system protein